MDVAHFCESVPDSIVDRSFNKLRNGIIGGVVGGFLGGLFFGLVNLSGAYIQSLSSYGNTSRAVSFVLLGLCIGLFIGLAQVILKETWITVEAGFRPGRQMILGKDIITMGTSEKSSMIFIAFGGTPAPAHGSKDCVPCHRCGSNGATASAGVS